MFEGTKTVMIKNCKELTSYDDSHGDKAIHLIQSTKYFFYDLKNDRIIREK